MEGLIDAIAAQIPYLVTGEVVVVDSDALMLGETTILLFGLDSIDRGQFCRIEGKMWECHAVAVRELEMISSLGTVICEVLSERDVYRRVLGTCSIDGLDLGEMLVRSGFAVARPDETDAYVAAEEAARAGGVGLWRSDFVLPADYRVLNLITETRPEPF
ncbi:MAG: thermonuclease family protein [Bauldia sp.]|nr:thermonuclease family protein [Bauldia sp.]